MAGRIVYAACQWAVLVVIANLGNPTMLGQFTLALAIAGPISFLCNLNMRSVLATDAKNSHRFSDYFVARFFLTTAGLLTICVVGAVSAHSTEALLVVAGVGLFKAFDSISDIIAGIFQKNEQMDKVAISSMLRGFASVSAMFVSLTTTGNIHFGVFLTALLWLLVMLVYDMRNALRLNGEWIKTSLESVINLVKTCLPLGFVGLLVSLNTNLSVYVVEYYLGTEYVGFLSAMLYFIVMGRLVSGSLAQAAAPHLSRCYASDKLGVYKRFLTKLLGVGAIIGLAGIIIAYAFGELLLSLVYSPVYGKYSAVFFWIMVAGGIGYITTFLGIGLTVLRLFKEMLLLHVIATSILLVFLLFLVPKFGLLGAAWSLVGGALSNLILSLGLHQFRVAGAFREETT